MRSVVTQKTQLVPLAQAAGALRCAAVLWSVLTVGCGHSMTGPRAVSVAGTWSGTVGAGAGGGRALRMTWMASQNGITVAGPATVSTSPAIRDLTFTGTMTGTIAGDQLLLTYTSSPGTIAELPACTLTGRGASSVAVTIAGTFDATFTGCEGLDLQPPADNALSLVKQ